MTARVSTRRWFGVTIALCLAALPALLEPAPAAAELPETPVLLASLGFTPDEVAQIQAGQLVRHSLAPASERELTAGLAFHVPVSPAQLVEQSKRDLLDRVDANMISYAAIATPGSLADFGKLTLAPDPAGRAQAYVSAAPGGDLHLSAEEIAAFRALGSGAAQSVVEAQVRSAFLDRVQADSERGLAGIEP
jgi:hypothetical protein